MVWGAPPSGYSKFIANKTKSLINVFEMLFADWVGTFTVWTVKKLGFSRITLALTAISFQKRLQSSLYLLKLRFISIEHNIRSLFEPSLKIVIFLCFCVFSRWHIERMNWNAFVVSLYTAYFLKIIYVSLIMTQYQWYHGGFKMIS